MNLNSEQYNKQEKERDGYYYPPQKSHWEKYKLYYLVFGSFFFTTLIILVSNSNTNKQIRKINEQTWQNNKENSNYFPGQLPQKNSEPGGWVYPKSSEQIEEDWVEKVIKQTEVQKEMKNWINCTKYLPKYQTQKGKSIDKHVLLYGPPGTGKSFLATEMARRNAVAYQRVNFETVLYVGSSIKEQRRIFGEAREILKSSSSDKPVVIIIEEIDSVGNKEQAHISPSQTDEVNGILKMFDDIQDYNFNIIVIATTNNPERLDSALIRPGRLGIQIEVPTLSEAEVSGLVSYTFETVKEEFRESADNSNKAWVEWPSNFLSDLQKSAQKVAKKNPRAGITFPDLKKAIIYSLGEKTNKNLPKIIPSSEVFEKDLEKIMKNKARSERRPFRYLPQPLPEKDEET